MRSPDSPSSETSSGISGHIRASSEHRPNIVRAFLGIFGHERSSYAILSVAGSRAVRFVAGSRAVVMPWRSNSTRSAARLRPRVGPPSSRHAVAGQSQQRDIIGHIRASSEHRPNIVRAFPGIFGHERSSYAILSVAGSRAVRFVAGSRAVRSVAAGMARRRIASVRLVACGSARRRIACRRACRVR